MRETNIQTTSRYSQRKIASPIGKLVLVASAEGLAGLYFDWAAAPTTLRSFVGGATKDRACEAMLDRAQADIDAYFRGELRSFTTPLVLSCGTPFQQRTWARLREIPFGETLSYTQLADRVGAPRGARAVGLANGVNPHSIIVPCHRVVGASGELRGYAGGLEAKRWLLDHEHGRGARFDRMVR